MFVEKTEAQKEGRLEAVARRHPGLFAFGLVVLAIAVTLGLLLKPGSAVILYQGF